MCIGDRYNTSTFAFASDDQKAEMLSLAQKAADSYNASAPEDTSSQLTTFNSIASSALTGICAVLDAEVPSTSTLQTDLLSESDLTDAFTQEGAADTLRGLAYGQAAAIQYTGYAMMLAVRLDPLGVSTLDALRSQIPVSYTHLDVYKRQLMGCTPFFKRSWAMP